MTCRALLSKLKRKTTQDFGSIPPSLLEGQTAWGISDDRLANLRRNTRSFRFLLTNQKRHESLGRCDVNLLSAGFAGLVTFSNIPVENRRVMNFSKTGYLKDYCYLIVSLFLSLLRPFRARFSLTLSLTSENSLHFDTKSTCKLHDNTSVRKVHRELKSCFKNCKAKAK